ncbi:MAG: DUF4388 domain-containing protein [Thermoanaerobaculia bacterium]
MPSLHPVMTPEPSPLVLPATAVTRCPHYTPTPGSPHKTLLIDLCPTLSVGLSEALEARGLRVSSLELGDQAADPGRPDLILLHLPAQGQELNLRESLPQVREVGRRFGSPPLVVLAAARDRALRVWALRQGADDYLVKPCHPDELVARCQRLICRRRSSGFLLRGELSAFPLVQVLQRCERLGCSESITLRCNLGVGSIEVRRGRFAGSEIGQLSGIDALFSLLSLRDGHFAVQTRSVDREGEPEGLEVEGLLMDFAWLQDELKRRQGRLPEPHSRFHLGTASASSLGDLDRLPVAEVLQYLGHHPGSTLFHLEHTLPLAKERLLVTLSCLSEEGILERRA